MLPLCYAWGVTATADAPNVQPSATVDWEEMRALFCKGFTYRELSDKFNIPYSTVKSRAHRDHWQHTVAKVNEHVVQATTSGLTESANHWVNRIDKLVHKSISHAEKAADNNELKIRDLQVVLDCAEKANRIARANYGLDKADANHVHLHLGVNRPDEHSSRYPSTNVIDAIVLNDAEPTPTSDTATPTPPASQADPAT